MSTKSTASAKKPAAPPVQQEPGTAAKDRRELAQNHVGAIIGACSVCRMPVRDHLITHGWITAPAKEGTKEVHSVDESRKGTCSQFRLQTTSPSEWPPESLKAQCWKNLKFPFHGTRISDNIAHCTGYKW